MGREGEVWRERLIYPLEGWNGGALGLVEGGADDLPVGEVNLPVRYLLERQTMLHPVLVVAIREIFACVSTTGFLAGDGRLGSLDTVHGRGLVGGLS